MVLRAKSGMQSESQLGRMESANPLSTWQRILGKVAVEQDIVKLEIQLAWQPVKTNQQEELH